MVLDDESDPVVAAAIFLTNHVVLSNTIEERGGRGLGEVLSRRLSLSRTNTGVKYKARSLRIRSSS